MSPEKKESFYTSGEFARKAHVTLRTVRYYDQKNLLHPSARTASGTRLYTDQDLARLEQILVFRYLGFSLEDIREMTVASADRHFLLESLQIQKKLMEERKEEMEEASSAIDQTIHMIEENREPDYGDMMSLMHLTVMERSMKTQYQNAANISARIRLHRDYSINKEGWFPWIYRQMDLCDGMKVLEIGCGNGELWKENLKKMPEHAAVVLSDLSEGMIRDTRHSFEKDSRFECRVFDAERIPYEQNSFDRVIADHMLFYCEDINAVLNQCRRVLKTDGKMLAATYGSSHMKEITELVQEFNPDIVLSADHLYERFGLENGEGILRRHFDHVELRRYEDAIEIDEAEPLISYILSCHGNQNQLLLEHYREFHDFVNEKVRNGFRITKDAGLFVCW